MKFCPKCGCERYSESNFCHECGFNFTNLRKEEVHINKQCPYCSNNNGFKKASGGKVALKLYTDWAISPKKAATDIVGHVTEIYKSMKYDKPAYIEKELECKSCQRIFFECGKCGSYVKWEQKLKPCPSCGVTI